MPTQSEKAQAFRALHERSSAFIIPNPWDIGTARLLATLGFEALATTSAGYAFSLGQRDNTIDRDRMMVHVREIVAATDLPVSADLENGFGDDPETVAETIRQAAASGLAGGSIEDSTGGPATRSIGPSSRSNACAPPRRSSLRCPSRSPSLRVARTIWSAGRTSTTPSAASGPTRRPVPTCSTPPASRPKPTSPRWCARLTGR